MSDLEGLFPQLLYKNDHSAFMQLKGAIMSVGNGISGAKQTKGTENFNEKYTPIFNSLNEKIKDLKSLDEMIAEVKEDSEQMELIALNAMVISVKSGEKGLAFSKITENLQRLSKDMFVYSDKLSDEEAQLLEHINSLKTIFSGIIESQKSISAKDAECAAEIQQMLSNVNPSMTELAEKVDSIYPAIDRSMAVTKNKAAVSDGIHMAENAFDSLSGMTPVHTGGEDELDYLCFEIALYEKALALLSQVSSKLNRACSEFAGGWQQVIEIMENSDSLRMDFENRFLNNHAFGNDNIGKRITTIIERFQLMVADFNSYHSVQKDLQGICQNITAKAKTIYSVFENLRPVMSRLHHVRILQQIEVSKNDAIKSVQDSVTDMDNLINSANASLDGIQEILERFIQDMSTMLSGFLVSIAKDNENMVALRNDKELVFGDLQNSRSIIEKSFHDFAVFPDDFQKKCVAVQQNLQELMRLNSELSAFAGEVEAGKNECVIKKQSLMSENGLQNWSIQNPSYLSTLSKIK